MASNPMSEFIQHLRRAALLPDGAGQTDGQLLKDYITSRDEAALAALVRRHAPMVWSVCRRVLPNYHDAEDAFQATFLVLVRKAASIASRELLANWLYGVAHQTALKARTTAARRKGRERQVAEMTEPAVTEPDFWRDLQPLLDQELSRLPDKYRAVVVLCDLEGKTRKEAARQLGCPEGTVASRLATARTMLAKRLTQRGVVLSGGVLAGVLSQNVESAVMPTSLVSSTIKAATMFAAGQSAGLISVKVAALTEGVLKTMLLTKLKIATAVLVLLFVPVAGTTVGLLAHGALARQPSEGKQEKSETTTTRPEPERPFAPKPMAEKLPAGWTGISTIDPRHVFPSKSGNGWSATVDEDKDGALVVHLAFSTNKPGAAYRPVAGNTPGKCYPLKPTSQGGYYNPRLIRFRLDPQTLPASQANSWSIEFLSAEDRKIRANDALNRAKKLGVEVLPFPEIGSVYEFVLTALDGKIIRSEDLRGKVVLIDCWDMWPGSPSMSQNLNLKELYKQHRKDGLEIVGVCLEHEKAPFTARHVLQAQSLDWPQVLVPTEEKKKELWEEVLGIEGLPRLLLLDRSGVLRADCGPRELKDQIAKLLKETQAPDSRR